MFKIQKVGLLRRRNLRKEFCRKGWALASIGGKTIGERLEHARNLIGNYTLLVISYRLYVFCCVCFRSCSVLDFCKVFFSVLFLLFSTLYSPRIFISTTPCSFLSFYSLLSVLSSYSRILCSSSIFIQLVCWRLFHLGKRGVLSLVVVHSYASRYVMDQGFWL